MDLCKTIYSWQTPEVKALVNSLWESKPHELYDNNFLGNQDGTEIIFKKTWLDWASPVVSIDPASFPYFYSTNGSSEAIREIIYQLKVNGKHLHIFKNEYEGYKAFAHACGLAVTEHDREIWSEIFLTEKDTFILSQPSSLDGNVWTDYSLFMDHLQQNSSMCNVYLDLCYVGCVSKEYLVNLNSPLIKGIFISLSKAFGVYFHRIGGFLSKEESLGLYGNRWFKNIFSLHLGTELMKKFPVRYLPVKYKNLQSQVIAKYNQNNKEKFLPSDVFILAYSEKVIPEFARGSISRVCLTPSFYKEVV